MRRFQWASGCIVLCAVCFGAACDSRNLDDGVGESTDISLDYARSITWQPGDSAVLEPVDLAVADGRILIADEGSNNLRILDLSGRLVSVVGREGEGPGEFLGVRAIDVSADGSRIALSDARNHRVTVFDSSGQVVGDFVPDGPSVGDVAFDSEGRLHVDALGPVDASGAPGSPTIGVYSMDGRRVESYGSYAPERHLLGDRFNHQTRLALHHDGRWFVSVYRGRLWRVWRAPESSPSSDSLGIVLARPEAEVFTGPYVREVSEGSVAIIRMPVVHDLAADDRGRAFLLTVPAEGRGTIPDHLRVYGEDGEVLRSFPLDHEPHRVVIAGDSLYLLERALGDRVLPSIHVYAVRD